MYKQMDIFDFIEQPPEPPRSEQKTLLESLFSKINDPVMQCANCLCEHCTNNVEELWSKVQPEEQKLPCFNCDECRHYTGDTRHRSGRKEDCTQFVLSNYSAEKRRKKIKVVNGG